MDSPRSEYLSCAGLAGTLHELARVHRWRLYVFIAWVVLAGMVAFSLAFDPTALLRLGTAAVPCGLLALYGEYRALSVPGFGAVNFAEPVYFAVALEYGGSPAAALAALVGVLGDLVHRKTLRITAFNVGWALLTFTISGAMATHLGYRGVTHPGSWPALLAAAAMYGLVAGTLQAVCQSLEQQLPLRTTVDHQRHLMRYAVLSVLSLGGTLALLLASHPWMILLLAFPVEILSSFVEKDRLHRDLLATQQALVEAQKRSALGVMAAGLAHELNTPLGAIMVNCHVLRDPRATADERTRCLQLIERATDRSREIVAGLLGYARSSPAERRGALREALHDALVLLRHDLDRDGVQVAADLPDVTVAMPSGDLIRVLTNLTQNAHQACMQRASGRMLEISGTVQEGRVTVRVRDNGPGIPADHRDRIWDPFFTTRAPGSGTGLGLWVVHTLVEGAGGTVTLDSTAAEGTTFRCDLPLA